MATITITREYTKAEFPNVPLLSVHVPTSVEFEFDRGTEVNSYAVVTVNGYDFRAIKTGTVGNVDTYQLGGEMFISLLGMPTLNPLDVSSLQLVVTAVCKGYSSAGVLLASANHSSFKICNAIDRDKEYGLYVLQTAGRGSITPIYYTGYLVYFDVNNQVYKQIYSVENGIFSDDGCSFNVNYYSSEVGTPIFWLNIDGCFDSWNFTELTTKRESKLSNPISLYSNQLKDWKGYEINTMNDVEEEIVYRVIAKNAEHYEQLYFMAQSPLIMNQSGEIFEMAQRPAPLNPCKQNLNFTFSLKRKTHGQSY